MPISFSNGVSGVFDDLSVTNNIGIGTDSPTQPLDVNGNINISSGNLTFNNNTSLSESELISIINSKNIYMWSNYT